MKFEATDVPDYVFTVVFPPNKVKYSHSIIRGYLMGKVDPAQMSCIFWKLLNVTSPKAMARFYQCYTTNIWRPLLITRC